jgi:plastocyanin
MKRVLIFATVIAWLGAFLAPATFFGAAAVQAASGGTYTVTVGYENAATGALIQTYFPDVVTIHVGDTVHWVQGSHEIHTVTFLAGAPAPDLIIPDAKSPSGQSINPVAAFSARPSDGKWDGTYFVNSGIMSLDPPFPTSWDLTFTVAGSYNYYCLVHGVVMSGEVVVLPANQAAPSPAATVAQAAKELNAAKAGINDAFKAAEAQAAMYPPTPNADGSTNYHVMIGYTTADGKIDLMQFFPSSLKVHQGDMVYWYYGPMGQMGGMSMAPHTISFLNGTPDQPLTIPGTLYLNPLVFAPSAVINPTQAGQPLTRNGFYNSGVLAPGQSWNIKIGAILGVIKYQCLLHDTSGMTAQLVVSR